MCEGLATGQVPGTYRQRHSSTWALPGGEERLHRLLARYSLGSYPAISIIGGVG